MLKNLKSKGAKLIKDLQTASENRQMVKYGLPVMVVLLLINTIQVARFNTVIGPLTHYSEGLVDDLGRFRQDITGFGNDLNEMRSFLLLPTKDYSFSEKQTEDESEEQKENTDTEQALYLYLGKFIDAQNTAKNIERTRALTSALAKNATLVAGLKEQGLTVGKLNSTSSALSFKIGTAAENYFEVLGDLTAGNLALRDALGGSARLNGADEEALAQEILTQTKTGKETIVTVRQTIAQNQTLVKEALKSEALAKLLESKKLAILDNPELKKDANTFEIQNQDGKIMLTITVSPQDGKIRVSEKEVPPEANVAEVLIAAVSRLDGTTATEKLVQERKTELENILKEAAFSELLQSGGLKINPEPREAYNQWLYDVTDAEGKVQFSFVIELSSGAVKVLKDNQETDLLSVLEQNAKKKL